MPKITTVLYGDLALIPQIAEVPITETWGFLSDAMESYDGSEQIFQLRSKPRQTFAYSIPLQPDAASAAFNVVNGAIRQKWAIPVWSDAQFVGNIAAGASYVLCDTTNYDLRALSVAMLFTICGKYQILELPSIAGDRINVSVATQAFTGAYLVPVRIGYAVGAIGRPNNGYSAYLKINFDVEDTFAYTPSAPTQYLSNDIYFEPGLTQSDGSDESFDMLEQITDFDLGKIDRRTPWVRSKFGKTYRSRMDTPAQRKQYKDFIYRRLGKTRPFWMPTFENNIRVKNTGTVVSTLVGWLDAYDSYAMDRTHVAIETATGWQALALSAPTVTDATTIQYTLSSALNVPAESIRRVSYLGLNRLNTDLIEINHNSQLSESAVKILEISP